MFTLRRPADNHLMRTINRALILHRLRLEAPQSRAQLAAATGLTRSTVSSLIEELIAANLVHETGTGPSHGGRPGTLLALNPAGGCAIGVEITGHTVTVLLTDFTARPRWQQQMTFAATEADAVLARVEGLIDEALRFNAATDDTPPLGIGLGTAGLVRVGDGTLRAASNLGWSDIPFKARWEKRFRLPVWVGNEVSIAALGEHYFGVAAGYTDFIYLGLTRQAIGAGVFTRGALYQGIDGYAGEAGHMVIDPRGPRCSCGRRGCWEAVLRDVCREDLLSEAVVAVLATGITNLIHLFNPQLIVLGGSLGLAMEPLLPAIQQAVATPTALPPDSLPRLALSQIGPNACVQGAVALVLDDLMREPSG